MHQVAKVPGMQSAADFTAAIFAYNSRTMTVLTKRTSRPAVRKRGPAPLLLLAVVLVPCAAGAAEDQPKPSASPTPQETAPLPPDASATPQGRTVRSVFGAIVGTVFDTKKKPLAGWMVQLSSRGDDNLLRVTGTDDKGQYVFKDLPAGTYDIEIQVENEAARKKGRIEVRPPFRNIVDFQVGPQSQEKPNPLTGIVAEARKKAEEAGRIAPEVTAPAGESAKQVPVRGIFLDAQKRPVSEVSVTLVALDGKGTYQTFSGDNGSFEIPAVPPGRYRVLVFSPGYVPIDLKSIEVSSATGLSLSLALVDYPLNTKERPQERLPREQPLPAPNPDPTSQPS
jgi:carboxypeptidase family protein